MLWRHKVLTGLLWVALAAQVVSAFAIGTLGYSDNVPPNQISGTPIEPVVLALQKRAYLIYPFFSVVALVASVAIPFLIRARRFWAAIHDVLDEIQKHVFADLPDLPEDEKRVTLFKHCTFCPTYKKWPWRWRNWMVAIERSGQATRSNISMFHASMEAPGDAEGFAGRSWAQNLILTPKEALPFVDASNPKDLKSYAALSHVTADSCREWLSRRKKLPAGICGIPVEVQNQRWGSLVIDASVAIPTDRRALRLYSVFASIVGKLLE